MKKIYLLSLLCCLGFAAFAVNRYPTSITAPYAGVAQSVCQGSTNTATTVTYTVCGTTTAGGPLSVTPTWYLNGALVFTSASFTTVAGGGTITLAAASFTYTVAPGLYSGTNGLKCVLTWVGTSPAACGSVTTITGASTNITVSAPPTAITGPASFSFCQGT